MTADTGGPERKSGTLQKSSASLTRGGIPMTDKKAPIIDLHHLALTGRFLRWVPWVAYVGAGVGYLSGVLTTPQLPLLSLLLLTGTYGAWVVLLLIGQRWVAVIFHPGW